MKSLRQYWEEKPLQCILILAGLTRLLAALFSRGYGMHDDHFLVIEPAQAWLDGVDYNAWLPMFKEGAVPSGHSLLYPGLHYLLFALLKSLGLNNPDIKMLIVRLIHAAYSLLTVYFSYKIAAQVLNRKIAVQSGLLIAVLWFFPFLSVRNLVEVVCIPLLVYGTWLTVKPLSMNQLGRRFLWTGFILGLAFSIRYQTIVFSGGLFLALLIQRKWKAVFYGAAGYLFSVFLIQGGIDYFIWGEPFAEFREYAVYNMTHATHYIVNVWYMYLLLLLGILIPPVSIFLLAGFAVNWRKNLELFLPSFLFLLFHSIFPNKQERFILPLIPFVVVLGLIGWAAILEKQSWISKGKFLKISWVFFWVMNLLLLFPVSSMYSKRARVESMRYLSRYQGIHGILLEDSNSGYAPMVPKFYLGQWIQVKEISEKSPLSDYKEYTSALGKESLPAFVLFFDDRNLDTRLEQIKKIIPGLEYETCIQPGMLDRILYWLNPVNANQSIYIYRNLEYFPSAKD